MHHNISTIFAIQSLQNRTSFTIQLQQGLHNICIGTEYIPKQMQWYNTSDDRTGAQYCEPGPSFQQCQQMFITSRDSCYPTAATCHLNCCLTTALALLYGRDGSLVLRGGLSLCRAIILSHSLVCLSSSSTSAASLSSSSSTSH